MRCVPVSRHEHRNVLGDTRKDFKIIFHYHYFKQLRDNIKYYACEYSTTLLLHF